MRWCCFPILWSLMAWACSSGGGKPASAMGELATPALRDPDKRSAPAAPQAQYTSLERRIVTAGLREVVPGPGLRVELIYATAENFTGRVIYTDLHHCFLRPEATEKLAAAAAALTSKRPELHLRIVDCVRPVSVQRILWAAHPNPAHVANPETGTSLHNHGCAVDLTLASEKGDLELGTGLDEFAAGAKLTVTAEPELCRTGELSAEVCANRRLLRKVMTDAGFEPYSGEWWHFNGCERVLYPVLE